MSESSADPLDDYARIIARELVAPESPAERPQLRQKANIALDAASAIEKEPRVTTSSVAPQAHQANLVARLFKRVRLRMESFFRSQTTPRARNL